MFGIIFPCRSVSIEDVCLLHLSVQTSEHVRNACWNFLNVVMFECLRLLSFCGFSSFPFLFSPHSIFRDFLTTEDSYRAISGLVAKQGISNPISFLFFFSYRALTWLPQISGLLFVKCHKMQNEMTLNDRRGKKRLLCYMQMVSNFCMICWGCDRKVTVWLLVFCCG